MTDRICEQPDCERKHVARGLCKHHYYKAGYGWRPKVCSVEDCTEMTTGRSARGLCEMHYARKRRSGTTAAGNYYKPWLSLPEVLHDRSEPHGDCVLWTGVLTVDGYARIGSSSWGEATAHRFSWSLVHGPIPEGFQLDHLCHTRDRTCDPGNCLHRRCINPDHLELVTHAENTRRSRTRYVGCSCGCNCC